MGINKRVLFGVVFSLTFLGPSAFACTTFCISPSKEKVVGKSFDWDKANGQVITNLRGLKKTSLKLKPTDTVKTWGPVPYASLTFNQNGREFPLGGINEKGLVVEIMWLHSSIEPLPDARPSLNELQWIQYQLDNYSKTSDVVLNADLLRVSRIHAKVHYMVCDASGDCATFENIDGKMKKHSGTQIKATTLENDTYEASVRNLSKYAGFGGMLPIPSDLSRVTRFVHATVLANAFDPTGPRSAVDAAFDILQSVGPSDYSKFHIVYEPSEVKVNFRTWDFKKIKQVKMADFKSPDFSWDCDKSSDKTRTFDMNQDVQGDIVSLFKPYDSAENRDMVEEGLRGYPVPPGLVKILADYPQTVVCQ